MYARARWLLALRWVAAALVFESALSFRQRVCVVHQDKLGIGSSHRSSSSPLPSAVTLSALHTRSTSTSSTSITSRSRSSPRPGLARDHQRRRRRIRINRTTTQPPPPRGGSLLAVAAENAADASEERGSAAAAAPPSGAASSSEARQVSPSNPTEARAAAAAAKRHYDGDFLMEQKLESAKAAFLCGGVGAASRLLAVGVGAAAPPFLRDALATPEPAASAVLFGLAAGFVQGALFGLTYRYVVRSDRETPTAQQATQTKTKAALPQQMDGFTVGHLGDGCVAAFALTSALGQSEVPLALAAGEFAGVFERGGGVVEALAAVLLPAAPFLPRAAADLLFYSIARTAIDRALDQGAIKPFP